MPECFSGFFMSHGMERLTDTLYQFVLPATHNCTLHYILHSECATVQLQQSREEQTGIDPLFIAFL